MHALGFGNTNSPSLLGQRLDFSARIHLGPDEALARECVEAEVFSGDNKLGADQVRVTVRAGSDPNERTVRVTTLRAIDEPVVTVNLTAGCTSRVSRKFVTFLDPPVLYLAQASETESRPEDAPQRIDSQAAPLLAMLQPAASLPGSAMATTRPRTRKADRPRSVGSIGPRVAHPIRLAAADQATRPSSRRTAGAASSTASNAASGTARLQLEAGSPALAQTPALSASAAAPVAFESTPSQAGPDPAAQQLQALLVQERERTRNLETGLARLRSDAQATRQSLQALQARLREADGDRYANPLSYVLGGLCLLLAAATAFALQRPKKRGATRWWDPTQQPLAPEQVETGPSAARLDSGTSDTTDAAGTRPSLRFDSAAASSANGRTGARTIGGLEVTTVIDQTLFNRMAGGESDELAAPDAPAQRTPHESSLEELIDLEQQVEFFAVLGQDEAAIDLLSEHVDGAGAVSPLPFFKLLEIHRRRDDEPAYRDIAAAFYQRFGAFAPKWEAPSGPGRALVDYPQTIARLQKLWATPAEAMQALDAWLFKRQPADDTFELAAYRDLLFLYSIARELGDETGAEGIDLMLPMEESAVGARSVDVTLPDFTTPSQFALPHTRPSRPGVLDFDLSLPASLDADSELRKAV